MTDFVLPSLGHQIRDPIRPLDHHHGTALGQVVQASIQQEGARCKVCLYKIAA